MLQAKIIYSNACRLIEVKLLRKCGYISSCSKCGVMCCDPSLIERMEEIEQVLISFLIAKMAKYPNRSLPSGTTYQIPVVQFWEGECHVSRRGSWCGTKLRCASTCTERLEVAMVLIRIILIVTVGTKVFGWLSSKGRFTLHLEAGPSPCVRGLKFSLVTGEKAQIGSNTFTPIGRTNSLCKRFESLTHDWPKGSNRSEILYTHRPCHFVV